MARRRSTAGVRFEPGEVTVRFEDSDASSREALAALKELRFESDITPRQLDALRGRTDDLRAWLKNRPDRHDAFVRDPDFVLDVLAGTASPRRSAKRGPEKVARWSGVGRAAEIAAAGAELRDWAVREPGRLAEFLNSPTSAIETALPGRSDAFRKRLAATMAPPPKPKGSRRGGSGR